MNTRIQSSLERVVTALERSGDVKPASYLEQISLLIYLKLLDEQEPSSDSVGQPRPPVSSLFPAQTARFRWSAWHRRRGQDLQRFVHNEVLPYMASLIIEAPHVAEYFQGSDLEIHDFRTFETIVDVIGDIDFENEKPDQTGEVLEYLLTRLGDGAGYADFRTPRHLRALMVTMLDPKPGEAIYDPACGTGGFLADAVNYILASSSEEPRKLPIYGEQWLEDSFLTLRAAERKYPHLQTILREGASGHLDRTKLGQNLYGHDISLRMVRIATMNLVLQKVGAVHLRRANTLSVFSGLSDDEMTRRYDVVLSAPPFGSAPITDSIRADLPVISTRSELLFLGVAMRALRPGGRCALVVPEGLLFGETAAHVELRRKLLSNFEVLAVVSLPVGAFRPYSGVKTSVLVFREAPCERGATKRVWFYDVRRDGYTLDGRRRPSPEDNDIPDMLRQWSHYQSSGFRQAPGGRGMRLLNMDHSSERSWWTDIEAIEANGWDLSATRYRPLAPEPYASATTSPLELAVEISAKQSNLASAAERLCSLVRNGPAMNWHENRGSRGHWVRLESLVDIQGGRTPTKERDNLDYWGGPIPWVSPKDMPKDMNGYIMTDAVDHITERAVAENEVRCIEQDAVLIVVRSMILARMIPISIFHGRFSVNQDIKVLTPRPDSGMDLYYLFALLKSAEAHLLSRAQGTSNGSRSLRDEDLRNLPVELPPPDVMHQFGAIMRATLEVYSSGKRLSLDTSQFFDSIVKHTIPKTLSVPEASDGVRVRNKRRR